MTSLMSVAADAAEPPPVPLVLVLKLVSDTLVQPTTGVVVSADGHVVVASDFVREGDEIVVMDGGTDILKHARPAKLVSKSDISSLALLSVKDLKRPAIRFSQLISPADGDLHYAAFPDAERLAKGDPPLWIPVDLKPSPMQGEWFVTNVSTLPEIEGLVLDNCGQLAGFALASYHPSPYQGQSRMIMGGRLVATLKQLDVSLSSVFCDDKPESQRLAEEQAQLDESVENVANSPTVTQQAEAIEPLSDTTDLSPDTEPALSSGDQQQATDTGVSSGATERNLAPSAPSIWSLVPVWLWVLIALLSAALIFKLGTLWRLVNRGPENVAQHAPRHAPAVEPATVELLAGSAVRSRGIGNTDEPMPDINTLPEGFNAIVSVVGQFDNGQKFARYCIVDKGHIDIIIGRGDADISLQSTAVSRQHARLKGTANALTFSDLGSQNGTFIGAIPCLPGEIMFIEPNDEITLADARFRIGVRIRMVRPS
jgi:hypothetical protein